MLGLEAADRRQDILEAREELRDGAGARIRAAARKEIPTPQRHLAMARRARHALPPAGRPAG